MAKIETSILVSVGGGDAEADFPKAIVEYRHIPAHPGTFESGGMQTSPSEPEGVEIDAVYVLRDEYEYGQKKPGVRRNLPDWMVEGLTGQLAAACMADHRERRQAAEDDAADRRYREMRDEARS